MLLLCGGLVNGPYALITTAVSADLVRAEASWEASGRRLLIHTVSIYMWCQQGTHDSLQGNSRALSTVTAIIDGTGSIGACKTRDVDLFCFYKLQKIHLSEIKSRLTVKRQRVVHTLSSRGSCSSLDC